ncbi:MAG: MBOAT family protein, partial [Nitrospirota bacterium]|nr:MBOAT family protein [Nitrospirota bacterium]
MLFNSYEYIFVFLPVMLAGFFLLGRKVHHQVALAWLAMGSLFFYGWWNHAYVSLIVGSMIFNYAVGFQLQSPKITEGFRRCLLTFGVSVNLALIGYFKYANFFVDNLNSTVGTTFHLEKIILPLAISFFTFQQIAYLVDARRQELHEHNFLHYFLFVTFFPQLIAGPIVHHKEIMPQFLKDKMYRPKAENFAAGITVFGIGLFKKVILADEVAEYATPIFDIAGSASAPLTFFDSWSGAVAYTLQIYFDFSGYTDMAIGSAIMFGIMLPLNFNSPYKAYNIIDFWRRWHMTLSRFFRDYLYIPLGGGRAGGAKMAVNLIITMLLGGLWHGAGWTFVLWGLLHGVYLAINHVWRTFREKVLGHDMKRVSFIGRAASITVTMFAVILGWVFFRAETPNAAAAMLKGMFGMNGATLPNAIIKMHPILTRIFENLHIQSDATSGTLFITKWISLLLISSILFLPNSIQYMNSVFFGKELSNARLFAHAMLASVMIVWAVIAIGKPSEFLYF